MIKLIKWWLRIGWTLENIQISWVNGVHCNVETWKSLSGETRTVIKLRKQSYY